MGTTGMQALAGEPADYDQLYATHRGRVMRLCNLLLGDVDEAQEVSQEVFLKLHRALPRGDGTVVWGAWLTTVTVNACRDRRRSRWWRWARHGEELVESRHAGLWPTPEQAALNAETRRRIWTAFRALPTRQREVFALRHLEGWSTEEVAPTLRVSTGSVKRHLFRAVRHMRRALGDRT